MKIVCFGHRQHVGKDTAALILMTQLKNANSRLKVARIGLADSLKGICEDMYGWAGLQGLVFYENHPEFKDRPLATLGCTPRDIWLRIGLAVQTVSPITLSQLAVQSADLDVLIISDLRRWEEAEFFERLGAYLCRINRNVPKLEDVSPNNPYKHLDTSLDNWPRWYREFDNNGDLKALNGMIRPLAQEVLAAVTTEIT